MKVDIVDISNRGSLCVLELDRDVPFEVKRVYYVFGEKERAHRGFHAHKELWEVFYCPYGKITVVLDDGNERTEVLLDNPAKGLIVPPQYWRETIWHMNDSLFCALASAPYDKDDYLNSYEEFKHFWLGK